MEIEISPLTEGQSRDMFQTLIAPDAPQPNASVRRALLKAAAGFPMVLELLVQDWETNGDQSLALAVDAMTAEFGGIGAPPVIYREALERLVRAMGQEAQAVLNIASILGRRLNDISLYATADLSVSQTMAGMAELVTRRVLRDGGQGLEFVNELVRTAAYLGVPSPLRRVLHGSIADMLIKLDENGQEGLGLEIAWHCMRAGRSPEATPHLMRGVREAMRTGAPQEAERALASALPSLTGETLAEAALLLAEALQEEGRHVESLDILSSVAGTVHGHWKVRSTALTALGRRSLGVSPTSIQEHLAELAASGRSCTDPSTRALAGRAMAFLLLESRDHGMIHEVLELLDSIPSSAVDADTIAEMALARATLLYQSGDSQESFAQAAMAVDDLKRRGAANLVTVQLQAGLGSLKSGSGEYEAAIASYDEALAMANRLGNERQIASIAGNIALCCGRLGRYSEQLAWADKALLPTRPEFAGFSEIQWAYNQAFAHAMLGRSDLAITTIQSLESRLTGPIGRWVIQAWGLWKADLLLLCNQQTEAIASARFALVDYSFELQTPAFAGPYARWLNLATESAVEKAIATETFRYMAGNLTGYDALDQLEILCAISLHENAVPSSGVRVLIQQKLNCLPGAVRAQLSRLKQLVLDQAY
jgi:tetratricopeptide (TPR) repeat protein